MKLLVPALVSALLISGSPAAHATAAVPSLTWTDCQDGFECATAEVPLDHRNPSGEKIRLGLTRKPAADPSRRIGSLFVNPGGPGGSVDAMMSYLVASGPAELRDRFDIVGFDPRGVGRSQPIACQTQDEYAAEWAKASSRPRGGSFDSALRSGRKFTDACSRQSGKLLPFVGTEYVVRDMELLRRAVGDEKLTYFGVSYGTYIGTVYANLFPGKVRALALDGGYDPHTYANRPYEYDLGQYKAVESALGRFFDWCERTRCEFGGDDPRSAFMALQDALDGDPVIDNGRFVGNGATLTFNVQASLGGGELAWPFLAEALVDAQNRTGVLLPVPEVGFLSANTVVECADRTFPRGQLEARLAIASRIAPVTGPALAYAVPNYDHAHATACTQWPVKSQSRYTGPFSAAGAPPILVVGNTGDPDTPYRDSVALASTLRSGHLLTYRGEGHTGFTQSQKCVAEKVAAYLTEGSLPPRGTVCDD
ncbi:alpha/beta hydrolase [Lentzea jiangxiensis]|uniref:Alpha/beta hydrolase fold n=1 Tax=Lentzea jiangxiensis TaxID=641025 RepID=A0A1H0SMS9_9PSEU|nr:alpha/beta hydrolase [Lentzea jiangxiensis]SDP42476.1 alpha/beta hydrolase fold [Lentzea jiangxiensis]